AGGCPPLPPGSAAGAPAADRIQGRPACPPVTVARLLVVPIRAGHTGLAGGCAAVVAGRPEFAGKRQVRRGGVGLGPAVADQLGRPPLRHPAIFGDAEPVPVPALCRKSPHAISVSRAPLQVAGGRTLRWGPRSGGLLGRGAAGAPRGAGGGPRRAGWRGPAPRR